MKVESIHARDVELSPADAFALIEAMGTEGDRIWPARSMPFVRTRGPMRVGATEERHGVIRAVLARYDAPSTIEWRARVPFLEGSHSFHVAPTERGARVEHRLEARLAWWFVPMWLGSMARIHDRLVEALLDRLASAARSDVVRHAG